MVAAAVGVSAAAGLAGSAMSSSASKKAAGAQTEAADEANRIAQQQHEQSREDMQPWMQGGNAAQNALLYRLGIGQGGAGAGGRPLTEAEIRQELQGQFSTPGTAATPPTLDSLPGNVQRAIRNSNNGSTYGYDAQTGKYGFKYQIDNGGGDAGSNYQDAWHYVGDTPGTSASVDEAGLNAAVQQRMQQQSEAQAARQNDPTFNSLLGSYKPYEDYEAFKPYQEYKPYEYQEYKPYEGYKAYQDFGDYKPMTMEDFQADPGYQFRQEQGNQAIQNAAAATGGLNSGRALKDLTTFNSGLASQEYGNAYNRHVTDYNTGLAGHVTDYNTGLAGHVNDYNTGLNSHINNFNTGLNSNIQNYQTGFNANQNNYTTGLNSHINNYLTGFNAYNTDQNNIFNRLSAVSGMGQSAASSLAGQSNAYTGQVSNNLAQGANTQAAGIMGQNNAINQGIGSATNALTGYLTNQNGSGYAQGNTNNLSGTWGAVRQG